MIIKQSHNIYLYYRRGFTLIELSIVLVIIGLVVGGVLVGQDLVKAASVRATISQIESFQRAKNTFREKYGGIPGDLIYTDAQKFGFSTCTYSPGTNTHCDGNGNLSDGANTTGIASEMALFWIQLSKAGFIENGFTFSGADASDSFGVLSSTQIGQHLPEAKIGNGNYLTTAIDNTGSNNPTNYFI
jgi:prepilin-type N-terminal cleavage/methylation domain-containing protein